MDRQEAYATFRYAPGRVRAAGNTGPCFWRLKEEEHPCLGGRDWDQRALLTFPGGHPALTLAANLGSSYYYSIFKQYKYFKIKAYVIEWFPKVSKLVEPESVPTLRSTLTPEQISAPHPPGRSVPSSVMHHCVLPSWCLTPLETCHMPRNALFPILLSH